MRSAIEKNNISINISENKPKILQNMRTYLAAMLIITPSLQGESKVNNRLKYQESIGAYEEIYTPRKNLESLISYETIFKDGLKKALLGLNSINEIPKGGKPIIYYRDVGILKGKPIQPEFVKKLNLPEMFDISPKSVLNPIVSMVLSLGNRHFEITPTVGKIQKVYLTEEVFIIQTNIFGLTFVYDKESQLPNLLFRFWNTSPEKGEKKGLFKGSTVREI